MALGIGCEAAGESIVVYPQVLESREDESEKILLIEDYTLNLKKASVLADTVLLLDVTDDGTVERRTGMVNATHRIAPFTSWERSSQQSVPHRVSEIDAVSGDYEIMERSAKTPGAFSRAFVENDPSPKYTIELYFITGLNHSSFFGNEIEDRVSYAIIFVNATTPPYLSLHQDGNMIVYSTMNELSKHVKKDRLKSKSDVVYMASRLGAPHDGEGEAKDCGIRSPYLMSPYRQGKTIFIGRLTEDSVTVYPQVLEARDDGSEKVLILHEGYSLNLKKASILARRLLLRDVTKDGIIEQYVSLRMDQLNPPVPIGLTKIQTTSKDNEDYVLLWENGDLIGNETLKKLNEVLQAERDYKVADAVYMATGFHNVEHD
ncbi:hypothetical protein HPB50_003251 [Hyalomma asiaticum]|uniref:Uncharacterized protein n=1 Tax=Hyalomma asiaticum TaxID=266040 RepID=A0ACB7RMI7_HYAAI|nr:hypothetical protein HPB50_003251 [Hyalomma asiaticum]